MTEGKDKGLSLDDDGGASSRRGGRDVESAPPLQNERCFQSLIENSQDVITVMDAEGIIRYESPAIETVLGYKPHELVGTRGASVLHPEDVETTVASFGKLKQEPDGAKHGELRFIHKDGTVRYAEGTVRNLLHDPNVKGLVLNGRDITARKKSEERISQLNRRLAMQSSVNRSIIYSRDEAKLAYEICRTIVSHGNYLLAWLGVADKQRPRTVRIISLAGATADPGRDRELSWAEGENAPFWAICLRKKEPVVTGDPKTDPLWAPDAISSSLPPCRCGIAIPLAGDALV
ncbi:MAG: PAS domain S-box protein, partial [Smithellaceae bacterium]|nr:PAS domain S-box protein [Smithellaceae bacterium]